MPPALLLHHAARLLRFILSGSAPADKQIERYFASQRALGIRDRGAVAEMVYGCLRRRLYLEHLLGRPAAKAEALIAAYGVAFAGWKEEELKRAGYVAEGGLPEAETLALRAAQMDFASLPLSAQTDLPPWLLQPLAARLGKDELKRLAAALNAPASLDLRVNVLKTDRDAAAAQLAEEGFPAEPTPHSPAGLRRHERTPLFKTRAFQEGLVEVQDEGSQLLALLLEPKRREMVVDFCAGAGGKTLQLGTMMANAGTLYAFDVAAHRLERLKPRLKRAGLDNVRMVAIAHENDERVKRLRGKIDRVLVDAPCSGTGTLRRNPDIKWRDVDLDELTGLQDRILEAAAALVKPGGRLVYATCSLLQEENEDRVAAFLARHAEFRQLNAGEVLKRAGVELDMPGPDLRLYPHVHRTDGFFAAVLQR